MAYNNDTIMKIAKYIMKIKNKKLLCVVMLVLVALICGVVLLNALRPLPGSGLEPAVVPIIPIVAGGANFAITNDGVLWRWGFVNRHEDGTITTHKEPQKVMEDAVAVFAQGLTTMTICPDGTLRTQGRPIQGLRSWFTRFIWMITPLNAPYDHEPTAIMNNAIFASFSSGEWSHAMVITSDGGLWGWGYNRFGQLGTGTAEDIHRRPTRVMDDVIDVAVSRLSTFAVTSDGVLWAWGYNNGGRLGDGTTENRRNPVKILNNVIAVAASDSTTFAITSDATLWAWGGNRNGRLGDGSTERRLSPVHVMENIIAVSAGSTHTMAITSHGELWAWGDNQHGQLGDGTTEDRHSPIHIMNDVVAVSAGSNHTLAVTSDGVLWAWGGNQHGQLGDGTTEDRHSPVRIMEGVLVPSP